MPLPKSQTSVAAAAVADAVDAAAEPPINAPVDVEAAAAVFEPKSRRDAASTVHASGAKTGPSPVSPVANQESKVEPIPTAEVDAAAAGDDGTGAAAETA